MRFHIEQQTLSKEGTLSFYISHSITSSIMERSELLCSKILKKKREKERQNRLIKMAEENGTYIPHSGGNYKPSKYGIGIRPIGFELK